MQWDASEYAGFSQMRPWLLPTSQAEISVEAEEAKGQILPFYRELVRLRHELPLIAEGTYAPFAPEHESVYGFLREHEGQKLLVLCNFYGQDAVVEVPAEFAAGSVLVCNYKNPEPLAEAELSGQLTLRDSSNPARAELTPEQSGSLALQLPHNLQQGIHIALRRKAWTLRVTRQRSIVVKPIPHQQNRPRHRVAGHFRPNHL